MVSRFGFKCTFCGKILRETSSSFGRKEVREVYTKGFLGKVSSEGRLESLGGISQTWKRKKPSRLSKTHLRKCEIAPYFVHLESSISMGVEQDPRPKRCPGP